MDKSRENKTILFTIKSRLENLLMVRLAAKSIIAHVITDEIAAGQIELCLIEATTNIITHAYQSRQNQDIRIEVTLYDDHICFRLTDNGLPAKLLEKKELHFDFKDLNSAPEGEMGLFIIHSIMDEVTYTPGNMKNTLTMIKYFKT
ncbi:ATP-binding protein [Desulfobacter curvatus]|uniref:ATP-binding protein n=1 Tax=Desulfobacter curvatus TaxID=2290 RepID=UPI00036D2D31|nr:ATP-binding protein [Desulfobacter curvatus]